MLTVSVVGSAGSNPAGVELIYFLRVRSKPALSKGWLGGAAEGHPGGVNIFLGIEINLMT